MTLVWERGYRRHSTHRTHWLIGQPAAMPWMSWPV
jgi:hypothetical protein